MVYTAPESDLAQVDHEVKLILRADNTRQGDETAVITLKARAVTGVCELPTEIDFGNVMQDDARDPAVHHPQPHPAPRRGDHRRDHSQLGRPRVVRLRRGGIRGTR